MNKQEERKIKVCLSGSTKFKAEFESERKRLESLGILVLSPEIFSHSDNVELTNDDREKLIIEHFERIESCDWMEVIDKDGYIGDGTMYEIAYAKKLGKDIAYYSKKKYLRLKDIHYDICSNRS